MNKSYGRSGSIWSVFKSENRLMSSYPQQGLQLWFTLWKPVLWIHVANVWVVCFSDLWSKNNETRNSISCEVIHIAISKIGGNPLRKIAFLVYIKLASKSISRKKISKASLQILREIVVLLIQSERVVKGFQHVSENRHYTWNISMQINMFCEKFFK